MKLEILETRALLGGGTAEKTDGAVAEKNSLETQDIYNTRADDTLERDGIEATSDLTATILSDIEHVIDIGFIGLGATLMSAGGSTFVFNLIHYILLKETDNNPSKQSAIFAVLTSMTGAVIGGVLALEPLLTTYAPWSDASSAISKTAAWTTAGAGFLLGLTPSCYLGVKILPLCKFYLGTYDQIPASGNGVVHVINNDNDNDVTDL